jgi:hypothetical protein
MGHRPARHRLYLFDVATGAALDDAPSPSPSRESFAGAAAEPPDAVAPRIA